MEKETEEIQLCGHQRCVRDTSFPGPWCRVFSLPPTECRVTFRDGPFPVKILQQNKNLLKGIISFCVDKEKEEKKFCWCKKRENKKVSILSNFSGLSAIYRRNNI